MKRINYTFDRFDVVACISLRGIGMEGNCVDASI